MAETPAKIKVTRAAVAQRHTVFVGKPAMNGQPSTQRACGPGTVVELPEEEATFLMSRGFLADPEAPAVLYGPGPTYGADGDMIQRATNGG